MPAARKYPIPTSKPSAPSAEATVVARAAISTNVSENTVKRLVSPYPFAVELLRDGLPPCKGQIVKLTDVGFLMKVEAPNFYRISERYTVSFSLPVVDSQVQCGGKVVKTYDGKEKHLVEIHFIELPSNAKTSINTYLAKSGQKKF